jgi:peptide/nickel transport system substrate-binding protein
VSGSDASGNTYSANDSETYSVDTTASASITLDANITLDDIINAVEAGQNITVTGTVGGDVKVGDAVTVTSNGNSYNTNVVDLGGGVLGFSVAVSGTDLAAQTSLTASVSGSDASGNTYSANDSESYSVDTTATASITLDANITADDIINAATIYVEALKRLGIAASIVTVDSAQYKERTTNYDFDMTHYIRSLSLSPGNEQTLYWGSAGVTEPGTRNWMGMNSPAAEAMIATMVAAPDATEFTSAVQALDRVLTSGRYVVPVWYSDVSRLAHRKELQFPARLPIYGDWPGFQPEVWWYQE